MHGEAAARVSPVASSSGKLLADSLVPLSHRLKCHPKSGASIVPPCGPRWCHTNARRFHITDLLNGQFGRDLAPQTIIKKQLANRGINRFRS